MEETKFDGLDLTPGSFIPQYKVDELVGFRKKDDPDKYSFAVLGLIEIIEEFATTQMGDRQCRAVQHKNGIKILTTQEISGYFNRQQESIYRQMNRSTKYLDNQNIGELTAEQRSELNRTRLRAHLMCAGMESAMRKYPMPEPKLELPTVSDGESFKKRNRFLKRA